MVVISKLTKQHTIMQRRLVFLFQDGRNQKKNSNSNSMLQLQFMI